MTDDRCAAYYMICFNSIQNSWRRSEFGETSQTEVPVENLEYIQFKFKYCNNNNNNNNKNFIKVSNF